MAIDPSIPLQTRNPRLFNAADVLSLQSLMSQAQLRQQQMAAAQKEAEQEAAVQAIAGDPSMYDASGNISLAGIRKLDATKFGVGQQALRAQNDAAQRRTQTRAAEAALAKQEREVEEGVLKAAVSGAMALEGQPGATPEAVDKAYREGVRREFERVRSSGSLDFVEDVDAFLSDKLATIPDYAQARGIVLGPQGQAAERKEEVAAAKSARDETRDAARLALDKARYDLDVWKANNPTPAARNTTPENAGKFASMKAARKDIDAVRSIVFDKDGSLNRKALVAANVPGTGGVGTEGRNLKSAIYNVADVILRMRTGAAANESEVRKLADTFSPSPIDTEDSAKFKLDRLQELFDEAIAIAEQSMPAAPAAPAAPPTKAAPPVKSGPKATKQPITGPFSDPEKERRYQEWKKRQEGLKQ